MTLSATARAASNARETGETLLTLLEITAPDGTVLRYVNNSQPITHLGQTFASWAFSARLPDQRQGGLPLVQLDIDDTLRPVSRALRSARRPLPAVAKAVLASSPDVIEIGPIAGFLSAGTVTSGAVSSQIAINTILDRAVSSKKMLPQTTPGIF